jgi:hypothetical protein
MQSEYLKTAIVGGWGLGLAAIGISVNLASLSDWTLFVGLGLLPPVIFLLMWSHTAASLSESRRVPR